jgi:hypothetical protein
MLEELYHFLLSLTPFLGMNVHVWSIVVYSAFCLMAFYKISKYYNLIVSAILALLVGIIANDIYETIWTVFAQIPSKRAKFLKINKTVIILFSVELLTFFILYFTGHYIVLRPWYLSGGNAPDPHDWLWMINKGIGAWILYPLILNKKQRDVFKLKHGVKNKK